MQNNDNAESILKELASHLSYDAEVNGSKFTSRPIGTLVLSTETGSLWKRVLGVVGYEPDMIRDIIAPAIKQQLEK